jgi:NADH:ubiquinone oxidoreductase subunit D/NADH:ubiquinone oxidoreductase subunit C
VSLAQTEATLRTRLPGAQVEWAESRGSTVLTVDSATLLAAAEMLRDEPELRFDLLLAGTLAQDRMCYALVSTSHQQRICLQTTPLRAPVSVPSLALVWPAANWIEREAHDTLGLAFAGHPDAEPLLWPAPGPPVLRFGDARETYYHGTRYLTSIDGLELALQVQGDRIKGVKPRLGRRHVGIGRHLIRARYDRGPALAARLDGFAVLSCDLAYVLAVETLLGVTVPPRAQVLRVLYAELARLASHLSWVARLTRDATEPSFVGPSRALQGRSAILDLFEELGGNPVIPDLVAVGGLRQDAPVYLADAVHGLVPKLSELLDDLHHLTDRGGLQGQLQGIGVIDAGTAVGLGLTGPCLRASGVVYDVRQAFPYAAYSLLDLDIPTMDAGDAAARCTVRLAETRSSLELVQQCLARLEKGPVDALEGTRRPDGVPHGMAYAAVEGPRGEVGVLVAANGSAYLDSVYVRGPSFANLSALPLMAPGTPLSLFRLLTDSLDLSAGEVER